MEEEKFCEGWQERQIVPTVTAEKQKIDVVAWYECVITKWTSF